ncbi:outer membrane lipoprotein carrier protein LolA [Persicimonas caeni]|uniref:Outer membrane lipoprotein carrier protein LolA n=1 Tax=Persicimonas caeni TaxID=2292766 RepID=A0A4Y6PNS3_PERCE|nr:outer membrane lipoprotein carrier protein LolA [Persicimonas caeni]QDG49843.1 outer membrane lipoprotein carrier protein LolA [Persicimonas caeni]QED31064.1 outer membrane lipoprotein carrier protein LolA [Persicimonas caeni]
MKQSTKKSGRIARIFGSKSLSKFAMGACVVTLGVAVSLSPSAEHVVTVSSPVQAKETKGEGPADMSAEDVAKRVQKFYKKTKDYHAHFQQTYTDVAAGSKKKSQGRVYFKKPGKMRWDYYKDDGKGRKKVLVSDGESFWIYEYEFKQVFKKCLASSQLPTSLKFLMGQGNLLKEFNVSFADSSTAKAPVLELVPKEPTSKYTKLVFELDPKTFQVEQTTIYDPYGNTNQIEFNKAKINKNLPDSGFNFKVPKGARVLNPQKKCASTSSNSSKSSTESADTSED